MKAQYNFLYILYMITVPNAFTSLDISVFIFQLFLHATHKDNLIFNFKFVNFNSTDFFSICLFANLYFINSQIRHFIAFSFIFFYSSIHFMIETLKCNKCSMYYEAIAI